MPYRLNRQDFSSYLSGMSEANAIRTRGNETLHRGILTGLLGVGEGLEKRRVERESKRRFAIQEGQQSREQDRADAALALRMAEYEQKNLEDAQEAQANRTWLFDQLGLAVDATNEGAATGEVPPEATTVVRQATDALGGPEAVMARWRQRTAASYAPVGAQAPAPAQPAAMPFEEWAARNCPT